MGYRTRIARKFFSHTRSWRDWPACTVLALARLAVSPANRIHPCIARLLPKTLTLRFKRFGSIPVSLDPTNLTHLQVLEEFLLSNAYDLSLVPFRPAAILDCGTHIGLFLRLCLHHYPRVPITAFEPQAVNSRLALRASPSDQLTFHAAAVGPSDGHAFFDPQAMDGFGALTDSAPAANSLPIPTVDLLRILREQPPGPLLLKMDIEGGEHAVIPLIAPHLPPPCALFIEIHHGDDAWQKINQLLTGLGFTSKIINHRPDCACRDMLYLRAAPAASGS